MSAMNEWHNIASGRIFILGNAPSLADHRELFPALGREATFSCNGMSMHPDWLGFTPTYYGVTDIREWGWLDRLVPHQWQCPAFNVQFEDWPAHDAYITVPKAPDNIQVHSHGMAGLDETLPPVPTGRITPLTLMQLIAWMGYEEMYLLGSEMTRSYCYNPEATHSVRGHEFPADKNPKHQIAAQRCAERMRADLEAHGRAVYDCSPVGLFNGRSPQRRGVRVRQIWEYRDLAEVLA